MPRYPAPASETIPHDVHDFKTPYRDSMYYVRHDEVERSLDTVLFFSDPISESVPQKYTVLLSKAPPPQASRKGAAEQS